MGAPGLQHDARRVQQLLASGTDLVEVAHMHMNLLVLLPLLVPLKVTNRELYFAAATLSGTPTNQFNQ